MAVPAPKPKPSKLFTLYVKSNDNACQLAYAPMNRNPAIKDAVNVVNVDDRSRRPSGLRGVPCVVERNSAGASRTQYGSQAIRLMEWLATTYKGDDFASAQSTAFCALDGTGCVPSTGGGCALDYSYEFEQEITDSSTSSIEEQMRLRQTQDTKRAQPPSTSIADLQEKDDRTAKSLDELMLERQRADARATSAMRHPM